MGTRSEEFLARRRALGQDRFDEVWEGEYRMVPAPRFAHARVDSELQAVLRPLARAAGLVQATTFNLGERRDYRVPDQGYVRDGGWGLYVPTAALVVEILSPDDDTYLKFPFYAAHDVLEILVADPDTRRIEIHVLDDDGKSYARTDASRLLGVTAQELVAAVDWPPPPVAD